MIILEDNLTKLFRVIDYLGSNSQSSLDNLEIELIVIENDGKAFVWNCCQEEKREGIKQLLSSF